MADAPALSRLVGEVAPFLEDVWGRQPLYVQGADASGFAGLLSLDDVDRIVGSSALRAPAFRLVRDGRTLPMHQVTRQARIGSQAIDDLIDVAAVHAEVADGATLVLQGLHRSWPPVAELCRELELTLTHPVQANAYLTPPVATGLRLHGDPHDVFAVQTHGRKRWLVHPPHGEPWELMLAPGDVLYLPAGTPHAPETVHEPSLHLTVGVRTLTWADLVLRVVRDALGDAELERSLPAGWAAHPEPVRAELEHVLETVAARIGGGDAAAHAATERALEQAAKGFWSGRVPDLTGGLRDLFDLDRIEDTTWLRRRPGVVRSVQDGSEHLEVELGDRRLVMPSTLEPLVARINAVERLRPSDLTDLADEQSRLVLCRRFVREGVLTIERVDPAGG